LRVGLVATLVHRQVAEAAGEGRVVRLVDGVRVAVHELALARLRVEQVDVAPAVEHDVLYLPADGRRRGAAVVPRSATVCRTGVHAAWVVQTSGSASRPVAAGTAVGLVVGGVPSGG
jgi:hypothetical protein